MTEPPNEFDRQIRRYLYDVTLRRGYPPSLAETSGDLAVPCLSLNQETAL